MDTILTKRALALVTLGYLLYRFQKFAKWQKRAAAALPGPAVSLVSGNLPEMISYGGFTEEMFRAFHAKYGDFIRFFIFPYMMNCSINDPVLVSDLYQKTRDRPLETYMFLWYLGNENLMFQRGPIVKEMRLRYGKMITARSQLDKLNEVTQRETAAAVQKWLTPAGQAGRPVDIFEQLGPLIYDVMGQVMFHRPWLSSPEGREIYALHVYLIENVNRWLLWAAMPVGPLFYPPYLKYIMTIKKWRSCVAALIDEKAKEAEANPAKFANDESAIAMILKSKNEQGEPFFSRARAISTVCGFLNGAYDTTHVSTYWMVYHLAKYPEVQKKCLEDFAAQMPGVTEPGVDDLRKCEYFHATFMESMRIRATVPVNQRVNFSEDIEVGGFTIPKGVNVNIPNGVMHNDSRYFGDRCDLFRPERFLGESPQAVKARDSWMPFGAHSRMCIGFTFAQVEIKQMFYTILTRSTMEPEDPTDPGEVIIEAGVNAPKKHAKFYFRERDMRKMREEENLRWWMEQTAALDQIRASNIAPTA